MLTIGTLVNTTITLVIAGICSNLQQRPIPPVARIMGVAQHMVVAAIHVMNIGQNAVMRNLPKATCERIKTKCENDCNRFFIESISKYIFQIHE
jgi:hypothetical protein